MGRGKGEVVKAGPAHTPGGAALTRPVNDLSARKLLLGDGATPLVALPLFREFKTE